MLTSRRSFDLPQYTEWIPFQTNPLQLQDGSFSPAELPSPRHCYRHVQPPTALNIVPAIVEKRLYRCSVMIAKLSLLKRHEPTFLIR